jgi:cobalt-zinc-cadmium efflux system outer membrane protein
MCAAVVGHAQSPADAALTLAELERMALENNPTLVQAAASVDVARGRARQAGLFPNPSIGYTGDEIAGGVTIRGGEHGIFFEQTVPLGGKLRLSRHIFEREVSQAEALVEAQRYRVLNAVRIGYQEALAGQRRVDVRERLAQVAREAVTVSAQLYNVGAADRPDFLEAEIEARQMQLDLLTARNEQYRTWQRLASAVGSPTLLLRRLADAPQMPPEIDREQALERILRESPEMKAASAAIERAQAVLARAKREKIPDLTVRAGPRYNRELLEEDAAGNRRPVGWEGFADVGLTVPLFNRNQGNVAAAQAELSRAQAEVRRLELVLRARLATVFDEYLTGLRMAEEYQSEIIPRAEQAYALYVARFREMGAAYPQVLVAQRSLFQVTDRYVSALENTWRSALQIEGLLLTEGLDAPRVPGEVEGGRPGLDIQPGEMPRAIRTVGSPQ